ncbi:hypothetical protein [Methanospirillum lacunae]|uniref:Uncharacterized protein n=1 Tax=Methanospirillum lacunae TaxID=668570 RepID=A0A2V2N7H3_9EURY|nr:hypothetical protein [Methanospirillum lacunae]PWR72177.1 hypothetical protein DK846_09325 [Methanospirillum lacunae]
MKKLTSTNNYPSEVDWEKYNLLKSMFDGIFNELKILSKGKQKDELNPLKITKINFLLSKIKDLLVDQPSAEFLDLLNAENLPLSSDAIIIMSHYETALNEYWKKYHKLFPLL